MSCLKKPNQKQTLLIGEKFKTQIYCFYNKSTVNTILQVDKKLKRWKIICHAKTNQKKDGGAILTSD